MSKKKLDMYREFYESGAWPIERVDALLKAGKITQKEYNYIVGNDDAQ